MGTELKTIDDNAIIDFGITEEFLADLRVKFATIPAIETAKDLKTHTGRITELRNYWVALEKSRKEKKESILKRGKAIDEEASKITEVLKKIAEPWVAVKEEYEDRKEAEREEAARIEKERVDTIRQHIEYIRNYPLSLLNKTSDFIREKIAEIIDMEEKQQFDYQEFALEADEVKASAMEQMNRLLESAQAAEAERRVAAAAEAARTAAEATERARIAEERAKLEEQRKAQEAEMDAKRKEEEAKVAAERERLAAEQKIKDDALLLEYKKLEEKKQAEEALLAAERKKDADKRKAEQDTLDAEKKALAEREAALAPKEDIRQHTYLGGFKEPAYTSQYPDPESDDDILKRIDSEDLIRAYNMLKETCSSLRPSDGLEGNETAIEAYERGSEIGRAYLAAEVIAILEGRG